jgi:phage-related minor tail protein
MADDGFNDVSTQLGDVNVELARVGSLADSVGRSLTNAFRGAVTDGKSLQGVLADIGRAFSDMALKAALKPVGSLISGAVGSLFTALDPSLGRVTAFAKGGVVAVPTYFPTSTGTALAGEAGPEAILPLSRGADGTLGLAGTAAPVNVTFNVTATDARSFAASEAEISAMLLRAVKRGVRSS